MCAQKEVVMGNKGIICLLLVLSFLFCTGFTPEEFSIENLDEYEKEYIAEEVPACSYSSVKTYMPISTITSKSSRQYKFIEEHMTVDETTGLTYDEEGFIGVALGSVFGAIGTRYYITLDTGIILPVVKIDAKSDSHTIDGCYHANDKSVIEFVINRSLAEEFFGVGGNGLIRNGNLNNDERLKGRIEKVELVTDEKVPLPENQVEMIDPDNAVVVSITGIIK